jgi:hypothetical protein
MTFSEAGGSSTLTNNYAKAYDKHKSFVASTPQGSQRRCFPTAPHSSFCCPPVPPTFTSYPSAHIMFRAGAARQLRALSGLGASVPRNSQLSSKLCTLSQATRPLAIGKPMTLALARYASQMTPMDKINKEVEAKLGAQKLEAHPDIVSSTSSTHALFTEVATPEEKHDDGDMMAGVKTDLVSANSPLNNIG